MPKRLISMKEVLDRVPLSKTEIYRRIAAGRFPEPVRIGDRRIAFVEAEVSAWISDQIAKSKNLESPNEFR